MIYDVENINCIYCSTKLKFHDEWRRNYYICDCSKVSFKEETKEYYAVISLIDFEFIFRDNFIDVARITRNTHCDGLYDVLLEEINKFDCKNLNSLSEFYNYIKVCFISYEKNLVFL